MNELNDSQKVAAEHMYGAAMVIAGAGSGKTRVLTYRIAHMMENGIDPFNILALPFTNKAAKEMRDRVLKHLGGKLSSLSWLGTFHAISVKFLRSHAEAVGLKSNFTI